MVKYFPPKISPPKISFTPRHSPLPPEIFPSTNSHIPPRLAVRIELLGTALVTLTTAFCVIERENVGAGIFLFLIIGNAQVLLD
jgi:hypothetical protein